ncbi:ABC transporter ATP-binding protein [Candidatus Saccharibacteria bacterium]|nr:ABC transporter ATP-binding protein [Candidatus Saccharibacteria bacterium]MBR3332492.1 ABC transporter ATP-binding protein [Candidatus Saccharibacteria bacterium]
MAKKNNIKRTLYYFWTALMQSKIRSILLLILIPIWVFLSNVAIPFCTSQIIGKLSSGDFAIENYVSILSLTFLVTAANNIVVIRAIDWLDWSIDALGGEYLSKLAFTAVINQSMTFHNDRFSGSLTSAANKFPRSFIGLKSSFVWNIYPLFLSLFYAIGVAAVVCAPFAGILALYAVVYMTVAVVTYYKTRKVDEQLADAENKQTGQLADAITNEMSVKSYAREKLEKTRFGRATKNTKDATFKTAKISFWRNLAMNSVNMVTFAGLLILIVMSHDLFGTTIATMVFLYSLSNTLLSNIWSINFILRSTNRAFGDAKEMVEILDLPLIIDDKTDRPLEVSQAEIDFSHIAFSHHEQKDTLFDNFDLVVPAGKSIGLVGVSGSGKTTLTKLLLRFDDVSGGAIYIDGQDIRDVTQKSLREAIAYVPQESSLFHRSIFENIAYGKTDATREEVIKAAKLANADEFIRDLPEGYNTLVGERGVKLSGGQRQRVAIARAILKNAPILVLDEATSALDSESESLIQGALANLMSGRTSIVVAHRLSTVAGLDEIVVMKDGKIVERGPHHELLKQNGEYAKLWSRQSGAFLEET